MWLLIHRFSLIHTCDRRTDRLEIAYSVLCISSRILFTRTRQWQATPTACPLAHGLANPSSDTSSVQHCNFLPYYHQARHTRRLACQLAPPPPRRVIIYRPPEGAYSCYSMQPARRITYRVHRSTAGLIIASAPLASHRYTSVITCHINNTSHALRTADVGSATCPPTEPRRPAMLTLYLIPPPLTLFRLLWSS